MRAWKARPCMMAPQSRQPKASGSAPQFSQKRQNFTSASGANVLFETIKIVIKIHFYLLITRWTVKGFAIVLASTLLVWANCLPFRIIPFGNLASSVLRRKLFLNLDNWWERHDAS